MATGFANWMVIRNELSMYMHIHIHAVPYLSYHVQNVVCCTSRYRLTHWLPRWQSSWGHYGSHLGPVDPRWAACWPHEPCYRVMFGWNRLCQGNIQIFISTWTICLLSAWYYTTAGLISDFTLLAFINDWYHTRCTFDMFLSFPKVAY